MDIELLIFDLDGTLLDTKRDLTDSMNRTLRSYSLKDLSEADVWSYIGDGSDYFAKRCFGHFGSPVPAGALERFVTDYSLHCLDHTTVYAGIIPLLKRLGQFKRSIVTNKTHSVTLKLCDGLGISGYFDLIIGEGRFRKKPDPEPLLYAVEYFKVARGKSAIIGDSTIDVTAGENAGIKTIGVTWGVHTRQKLASASPEHIVSSPEELATLLLS